MENGLSSSSDLCFVHVVYGDPISPLSFSFLEVFFITCVCALLFYSLGEGGEICPFEEGISLYYNRKQ